MLTSDEILEKIQENMNEIRRFGVKKIGLFGSYVKDEQRTESDIDILVEFKKDQKTFDHYMDLKFFLEDLFKLNLFNLKVDLVISEAIQPDLKPYILDSVKYASGI